MKTQNKIHYTDKIRLLKRLKHELKRKRIILDEERTNFKLDRLEQLSRIKNTSELKGYPCVGFSHKIQELFNTQIGIKINHLETKYNKVDHPANLEHIILKKLTEELIDTNICPHIVYFLDNKKISNRSKSLKFISDSIKDLERENVIKNYSNVLFSEFVEGGCLNKWIKNCYGESTQSDNESTKSVSDSEKISSEEWKYITFSILYTMYILQTKYKIIHNDVHYGNILIDNTIKSDGYIAYIINIDNTDYTFYFKNFGFMPKIWDFEFAMCYDNTIKDLYPNKYVISDSNITKKSNIWKVSEDSTFYDKYKKDKDNTSYSSDNILCTPYNYNEYYDVHYFLTSLLDLYISKDLFEWIIKLFPKELIPEITDSTYLSYSSSSTFNSLEKELEYTDTTDKTENTESSEQSESSEEIFDSLSTESYTSSIDTYYTESDFLYRGRIINGVEQQFQLPTAKNLLLNPFFSEFLKKPDDFQENNCLFFKFN